MLNHGEPSIDETIGVIKRLGRTIIHDLNNPLSALSGYLQLTERRLAKVQAGDLSSVEYLANYHEKMQKAFSRIQEILQRLEQLVKNNPAPETSINLYQLWNRLIGQRDPKERERIEIVSEDPSLEINTIEPCLAQIGFELLDNALWATGEKGFVQVSLSLNKARSIVVLVRDTGKGMTPLMVEKGLYPCYLAREKIGFPKDGVLRGLGLSIAYHLTRNLGGTFLLSSQPEQGTQVRLEFPPEFIK